MSHVLLEADALLATPGLLLVDQVSTALRAPPQPHAHRVQLALIALVEPLLCLFALLVAMLWLVLVPVHSVQVGVLALRQ